jgi:diguanylate cyclase (GGDEF)-like protein
MKIVYRTMLPFVMPAMVLGAALLIGGGWPGWVHRAQVGGQLGALSIILPQLPYVFLGAALLLGWRFHQGGLVLAAWLLGVTYWAVQGGGWGREPAGASGPGGSTPLMCLVFIEMAILSAWRWRRLPARRMIPWLVVLLVQSAAFAATGSVRQWGHLWPKGIVSSPLLARLPAWSHPIHLTLPWGLQPEAVIFSCTGLFLLILGLRKRDVLLAGFFGAALAVFIGLGPVRISVGLPVSFSAAGLILVLGGIEASFFMAYRDELTGLPSRRALNQILCTLGREYTIAMIDVDHFKRFNDTYGHKTGDQVLRLLASRLATMSGGAKAFRYGGEEFTAVFPGKSVEEALPHLDACRKRLAETPFTVRGKARKSASASQRGKSGEKPGKQVRVTVSMGAAGPSTRLTTPSEVILAADKALYRAKKAGRNCVIG